MTYSAFIRIPSRLDHVWLLRTAVAGILQYKEISETEISLVQVALSEIANNCIEHGYGEDPSGTVEVTLNLAGDTLTLDIFDDAAPLPTRELQALLRAGHALDDDSDLWPARGRGLHIIRQIADQVRIDHVAGRNHVRMQKQLSQAMIPEPEFD